jgi:HD-GYP domain-containing protein (c-di-GMP phosphodiesterase class II)
LLLLLRQFVSHDLYVQNHSYRVSVYATKIAAELGLDEACVEDVRMAALLHDLGVLDISRDLLFRAARMTSEEFEKMKAEVLKDSGLAQQVGGSLRRVLPIIIGYHEKLDKAGGRLPLEEAIPIEARIISVAKAYDSLTAARPDHKPLSPLEAREQIFRGRGIEYDPEVVNAFLEAFNRGEMEIPTEAA